MPAAQLLSEKTLLVRLGEHAQWQHRDAVIERTVKLPSFPQTIGLVNAVAERAEAANHHPDIDIRYNIVRFQLSTHDSGGLTEQDFFMAGEIDLLVELSQPKAP